MIYTCSYVTTIKFWHWINSLEFTRGNTSRFGVTNIYIHIYIEQVYLNNKFDNSKQNRIAK